MPSIIIITVCYLQLFKNAAWYGLGLLFASETTEGQRGSPRCSTPRIQTKFSDVAKIFQVWWWHIAIFQEEVSYLNSNCFQNWEKKCPCVSPSLSSSALLIFWNTAAQDRSLAKISPLAIGSIGYFLSINHIHKTNFLKNFYEFRELTIRVVVAFLY